MKKKVYYGPDSVKAPLKWVLDFAMVMLFVFLWIVDQFDRLFLKKSNAGIKKAGNSSSRFFI